MPVGLSASILSGVCARASRRSESMSRNKGSRNSPAGRRAGRRKKRDGGSAAERHVQTEPVPAVARIIPLCGWTGAAIAALALVVRLIYIAESAASAVDDIDAGNVEAELTYPPGTKLTREERAAVRGLRLSPAARSALEKLVANACHWPLLHLFSLLDGVAGPDRDHAGEWTDRSR